VRPPIPTVLLPTVLLATVLLATALACASQRPSPTPPGLHPPAPALGAAPAAAAGTAAPPRVAIGGDAASVRRELGDPLKVERIDSAVAPGTRYERWLYAGGREVVLIDGKVADVLPP
jgi:hypothetical protein